MKCLKLGEKEFVVNFFSEKDCGNPVKFLNYVNSLIDDPEAVVSFKKKKTLRGERKWLIDVKKMVESKKMVMILAECSGEIAGSAAASLYSEKRDHIAEIGISVLKDYRGCGLGSFLVKELIRSVKKELNPAPSALRLSTFAQNGKAISFYEKHGFNIVAVIPRQFQHDSGFSDEIVMLKSV